VILVDTSVWIDHLRRGDNHLADLLLADVVACHPFVVGELACGGIQNREEFLSLLSALPMLPKVSDSELLGFIDGQSLMGRGLGLIDIHLLASCMLSRTSIWTRDARLAEAAHRLGLIHDAQD